MGRFIAFMGALLMAFALLNMTYLFILSMVDWDMSKAKQIKGFSGKNYEMLVLGNSTALDAINTELMSSALGDAYNLSLSGSNLHSNYVQLKTYLNNNSKPQRILLCLSSCHQTYENNIELHPIVDYVYNGLGLGKGLGELPIFKFRWLFVENFKKIISKDHRAAVMVKGQLRIKRAIADYTAYKNPPVDCLSAQTYLNGKYPYLDSIINLAIEDKITIDILEMPCWNVKQNNCPDLETNYRNTAVPIYNLNNKSRCRRILDSKKDWLSKDHLNENGGTKITSEIIGLIKSRNRLPIGRKIGNEKE